MAPGNYNILMYSHDTYGLGHIRRTMAIARNLLDDGVNILILTGSPIVGRFKFPEGIDFVRIPGMIKKSNTVYVPHSIKVNPKQAIDIRKQIISATAQSFDPDLFIVDKVPVGLKGEVLPTLHWFKENRPCTKIVLGLRDVLDSARRTQSEWKRKQYVKVLRELYSEVWVYGERDIYDPVSEYAIPSDIAEKTVFTGYIPREYPHIQNPQSEKREKLVVVTTGGGGDGYPVLDTYLKMLESCGSVPFRTLMIAGPFLTHDKLDELAARARKVKVRIVPFIKNIEKKLALADLVVSMGGYNTVCEILSYRRPSLLVPRDNPREEQLIRARVLKKQGVIDFIKWDDLGPELMREKIFGLLEDPSEMISSIGEFHMRGLKVMHQRLGAFREECS